MPNLNMWRRAILYYLETPNDCFLVGNMCGFRRDRKRVHKEYGCCRLLSHLGVADNSGLTNALGAFFVLCSALR